MSNKNNELDNWQAKSFLMQKDKETPNSIAMPNGELVEVDMNRLSQYEYNAKKDSEYGIYRVGNNIMDPMILLDPKSWRLIEMVIKKLSPYLSQIVTHSDFKEALSYGQKYIPPEFRTVTLESNEFAKEYGITQRAAMRQFTKDTYELMDERMVSISSNSEEESLKLTQIVNSITFKVRKGKSQQMTSYDARHIVEKKDGKLQVKHLCSQVEIELTNDIAQHLFLLADKFTRIHSKITTNMNTTSHKLYVMMCIKRSQNLYEDPWEFTWDLETWNNVLGTNHKYMSSLIKTFKAHLEITEKSDLCVSAFPDESSKEGKTYKRFTVRFIQDREFRRQVIEMPKGLVRPRLPYANKKAKVLGSQERVRWARSAIVILEKYKKDCEDINKKFPARDAKKLAEMEAIANGREPK
ncbi:replication initiation protein [Vibrio crassostreae]|uniref:replication initiation protein n=1 Tax=Vibrio crassostreae TaxID=246167 RepID=UPI001B312A67|nr:replication initiation protein [Vibrio crassostreae]